MGESQVKTFKKNQNQQESQNRPNTSPSFVSQPSPPSVSQTANFNRNNNNDTNSPHSAPNEEYPSCPVCSISFPVDKIHAHIESHFNDDNSKTPSTQQKNDTQEGEQTGFWGKFFKNNKKDNSGEIKPPTYNYAPPTPPTNTIPQNTI